MNHSSTWGTQETQYFYQLNPNIILDAVEKALSRRLTGRSLALNSMENRVYQLEIDLDQEPKNPYEKYVIAKFYRPGRWSKEQIKEEHNFLKKLQKADIPAVAPLEDSNGETLYFLEEFSIYFALFPKVGGRNPHELNKEQLKQTGRLLARMHNVGASIPTEHRMKLSIESYGLANLEYLKEKHLPLEIKPVYEQIVKRVCETYSHWFEGVPKFQIHGDAHTGNLLWDQEQAFWVDFDDSVIAPAIQDFWLLIGGRNDEARDKLHLLVRSYEEYREFPWESLRLIEILRFLRIVHFHGWIARRYDDPAFKAAFPDFGTMKYWNNEVKDLLEQEQAMTQFSWF